MKVSSKFLALLIVATLTISIHCWVVTNLEPDPFHQFSRVQPILALGSCIKIRASEVSGAGTVSDPEEGVLQSLIDYDPAYSENSNYYHCRNRFEVRLNELYVSSDSWWQPFVAYANRDVPVDLAIVNLTTCIVHPYHSDEYAPPPVEQDDESPIANTRKVIPRRVRWRVCELLIAEEFTTAADLQLYAEQKKQFTEGAIAAPPKRYKSGPIMGAAARYVIDLEHGSDADTMQQPAHLRAEWYKGQLFANRYIRYPEFVHPNEFCQKGKYLLDHLFSGNKDEHQELNNKLFCPRKFFNHENQTKGDGYSFQNCDSDFYCHKDYDVLHNSGYNDEDYDVNRFRYNAKDGVFEDLWDHHYFHPAPDTLLHDCIVLREKLIGEDGSTIDGGESVYCSYRHYMDHKANSKKMEVSKELSGDGYEYIWDNLNCLLRMFGGLSGTGGDAHLISYCLQYQRDDEPSERDYIVLPERSYPFSMFNLEDNKTDSANYSIRFYKQDEAVSHSIPPTQKIATRLITQRIVTGTPEPKPDTDTTTESTQPATDTTTESKSTTTDTTTESTQPTTGAPESIPEDKVNALEGSKKDVLS